MDRVRSPSADLLSRIETVASLIAQRAEPLDSIDRADLTTLLGRLQDCRIVLIGEATHGTSEFYRMHAMWHRRIGRPHAPYLPDTHPFTLLD